MNLAKLILPTMLIAPSGCAAQLEREASTKVESTCAASGKQFVKTGSEKSDGLFVSKATVSGVCVGPGETGYVAPVQKP